MKVIKDGRKALYAKCDKCDSILEYSQADVQGIPCNRHINCEICNNTILLDKQYEPLMSENNISKEEINKYVTQ